jgi:exodeoxyribonuclease V alpha subunit
MGNTIAQQTIMLRYSHRFDAQSAIGLWATWVNQQAVKSVKAAYPQLPAWTIDTSEAVVALPIIANDTQQLKQLCLAQWHRLNAYLHEAVDEETVDSWAKKCLGQLSEFQLLCAVREGRWGLVSMNERMAKWFGLDSSQWLAGRVVMVTRNDYTLNLMNGDIGLCLPHPRLGLRVAFATEKGIRWILPARLSHIEDAFAMSVHKSQGSEFNRVCLLLPEQDSPILTKELIYTAITRAKHQFILACTNPQQLFTAVGRSVQRAGGLSFV